ncbi:MAG: hypothetical protein GX800_13355 [Clostridiaceae bacterium]|nr:hypothetical protein [Clostridiaceae bacterium]
MKLGCYEVEKKLSEYLDDILVPSEKCAISEHINSCPHCAKQYEQLSSLVLELKSLPDEPLPTDFFEQYNKKLKNKKTTTYFRSLKTLSVIAAGLLIVLLGRTGYYYRINQTQTAYVNDAVFDTQTEADDETAPIISEQPRADNEKIISTDEPSSPKKQQEGYAMNNMQGVQQQQPQSKPQDIASDQTQPAQTPDTSQNETESQIEIESISANEDIPRPAADSLISAPQTRMTAGKEKNDVQPQTESFDGQAPQTSYSSSHDMDEPTFVSVIITVKDFEGALTALKENYDVKLTEGKIVLELENDDFEQVMSLMPQYGATVMQQEQTQPLTSNKCVIVPEE